MQGADRDHEHRPGSRSHKGWPGSEARLLQARIAHARFPKALSRTIRELRMEDAPRRAISQLLLDDYKRELRDRSLADVATVFTDR